MSNVPITAGSGTASVAAETVGGISYQQIEVYGGGGSSVLSVNPDGSFKASIIGTPTVNVGTQSGSVVAFQGTTPWIISSVYGNISGSVVGFLSSTNASIISVPQGSVAAIDTIASIAVANGGLPIWSPLTSRVQGSADFRTVQGASVAAIAAQGSGVFTYVTNVQIANFGSSSVLVTIADNTTSILGYTIAPAGGGSNYDAFYKSAANSPVTASLNGTASVLVSMQAFTSKT